MIKQDAETNICAICQDECFDNIKTPCNHLFHLDCIKQIQIPKCPICKKNIFKFLIGNGLSGNKIRNKINESKFNELKSSLLSDRNIDEIDDLEAFSLLSYCATINKKWKESIKNMIISSVSHSYDIFKEVYQYNWNNKEDGIFLVYCDLDTIFQNIILNNSSSLFRWGEIDVLIDNKNVKPMVINIKKESINKKIDFAILCVIYDDISNDHHIFCHKYTEKKTYEYPAKKEMIESLLSFNPLNLKITNHTEQNAESDWINNYYDKIKNIEQQITFLSLDESIAYLEKTICNIFNDLGNTYDIKILFSTMIKAYNFLGKYNNGNFSYCSIDKKKLNTIIPN